MKVEGVIALALVVEKGTGAITLVDGTGSGAGVETGIVVRLEVVVVAEIGTGIRLTVVSEAKAEKEIEAVPTVTATEAGARKEERRES